MAFSDETKTGKGSELGSRSDMIFKERLRGTTYNIVVLISTNVDAGTTTYGDNIKGRNVAAVRPRERLRAQNGHDWIGLKDF